MGLLQNLIKRYLLAQYNNVSERQLQGQMIGMMGPNNKAKEIMVNAVAYMNYNYNGYRCNQLFISYCNGCFLAMYLYNFYLKILNITLVIEDRLKDNTATRTTFLVLETYHPCSKSLNKTILFG